MNVWEAIKGRRSVRRFDPQQDVSPELVNRLLEAARWAPSAGNAQPWRFVVVRSPELKEKLAQAALGQRFLAQAPVVIVVCADLARTRDAYGHRGETLYCLQDTAAAIQNIHLAATELGLGTCWVGAFDESEVARLLALPPGFRPVALVPVGYPAEAPAPRPRRPLSEVVEYR
ncbi:nitroreductase family protein [Candidatus Bipolaricaulota bacterium]|nr:nitroreductase family protein [Candidatus Bipolaricaulota bacterium]